ncbi:MFS transporter [Telmatospirillum siberiense]|uniref:MFS transporter n=1 Tax=Telmatospirillum siberiense TaxID=382514 RepID=A0A2N3PXU4_9PROT|nr:MFS transporter [Telmatospirillum siberiense]PKU25232.1 MFS transporter [Telmatospirillum siberiense]
MPSDAPPAPVAARAALRYPDFRRYLAVRFAAGAGQLMQGVAVGWQVYALTHRPLYLGLLGLVLFLPQILLSLVAGHVADRLERRSIMAVCLAVEALCAATLFLASLDGLSGILPIFLIMSVFGVARAFLGPAMASLVPLLVRKEHFPNAVAWNAQAFQIAVVSGPALGGVLYGFGAETVYGVVTVLLTIALFSTLRIKSRLKPAGEGGVTLDRLFAGVRFVRDNPILLGAISLDLFAVLFGGATALLPVFASDILEVGPWGLGLLRSAPALGAATCALWLAHHPPKRRLGHLMFACVGGFGLATIVFGLSSHFLLSLAALISIGGCDMVSVYVRQSLIQLGTPDAMRGRVSAVNLVFIGASNELGEFESGLTAAWFGAVPAVVLGGLGTLLVVGVWAWRFKELRQIDRLEDMGG